MLTPLPMQRVELFLLKNDAPQAALLLANHGCFNPETSEATPRQLPELPGEEYRQAHSEARSHFDRIAAHFELAFPDPVSTPLQAVELEQLVTLKTWLKDVWAQCSEQQEHMRKLRDDHRHTRQLLKVLEQFMVLDIDLTQLQKQSRVMNIRVGTVPRDNAQRFEEALALAGHVAIRFFTGLEHVHLIIAGPTGQAQNVERVLQAAGWRTTEIPAEFHGRPAEMHADLITLLNRLGEQQAEEDAKRRAAPGREGLRERLREAAHTLARAAPYADLAGLMHGRGSLVTVSGWVPRGQVPSLEEMLRQPLAGRYALHARDPRPDERLLVPSLISHHRWLRPFISLVLNYGVPRYGEIDPTILFAISFVLMFGMMFGDVGQGGIIVLAGVVLRRRLGQYSALAIAVGTSSMLFGLLYGSVFGFEHILDALWMSPLADPMRMLGVALGWGIGFIALATALTIRNRIADGRLREALMCSPGAAGLLLYIGMLSAAWRYATAGQTGVAPLIAVGAALAAVFAYSWQHNPGAVFGERVLIVLIEGFESVMAYASNTLSFLRLAAFSLNHVALSIAIFTVADMMHGAGYWITVVLGNVFILVLEGAIVAIQTLRLEYYEGFSRFFGGDGRAFRPLALGSGNKAALRT